MKIASLCNSVFFLLLILWQQLQAHYIHGQSQHAHEPVARQYPGGAIGVPQTYGQGHIYTQYIGPPAAPPQVAHVPVDRQYSGGSIYRPPTYAQRPLHRQISGGPVPIQNTGGHVINVPPTYAREPVGRVPTYMQNARGPVYMHNAGGPVGVPSPPHAEGPLPPHVGRLASVPSHSEGSASVPLPHYSRRPVSVLSPQHAGGFVHRQNTGGSVNIADDRDVVIRQKASGEIIEERGRIPLGKQLYLETLRNQNSMKPTMAPPNVGRPTMEPVAIDKMFMYCICTSSKHERIPLLGCMQGFVPPTSVWSIDKSLHYCGYMAYMTNFGTRQVNPKRITPWEYETSLGINMACIVYTKVRPGEHKDIAEAITDKALMIAKCAFDMSKVSNEAVSNMNQVCCSR